MRRGERGGLVLFWSQTDLFRFKMSRAGSVTERGRSYIGGRGEVSKSGRKRHSHLFSPLFLPLQPTFRGNIKCSYNKKNMKIESDKNLLPSFLYVSLCICLVILLSTMIRRLSPSFHSYILSIIPPPPSSPPFVALL